MTTSGTIGANIRAELARKGVSQAALARHLGLAPSGVANRTSGRTTINVNELAAIADFLDVPVSRLLDGIAA